MKYAFIRDNREHFRVSTMCDILEVHRSGFYAWLKSPLSNRAKEDRELLKAIWTSYEASFGVYGSPRIHQDLKANGIRCGRKRVARLMTANQMVAQRGYKKRKFKSGKPSITAPNLVARQFTVDKPNEVWVTDITYIRSHSGWIYLAAVMDLCSRKIVGWSLQTTMHTDLVLDALLQAVWRRRPAPGLVIHSDQGGQFGSHDWAKFLEDHGIKPSMSRKGNCHDNAVKESFFSSLKMERIRQKSYASIEAARSDIFEYIEMFYNPTRRHTHLDFVSPNQYEAQL